MKNRKSNKFSGSSRGRLEFEEVRESIKLIRGFVNAAQYKKAFAHAEKLNTTFPDNRFARYRYAVSLGDCREWAPHTKVSINEARAAKILQSLLRRTSGIEEAWKNVWKNEYYWFSKQPKKQWNLGLSEVKKTGKGHYSMGVGAVSLSLNLYKKSKFRSAKAWARKAQLAWEDYFKYSPKYYNAHVWYAQSLGLQGDLKGMERALKMAAKLSKRPLSYREFVDARKDVLAALKKANPKVKSSSAE